MQFPSAPTIDGEFLPKHPIDMLKEGDFKKAELLMGSNLNEGKLNHNNITNIFCATKIPMQPVN